MQILRRAKNNRPVDSNTASVLINLLEIQILSLILLEKNIPFYGEILKFLKTNSQSALKTLLSLNLAFNLVFLAYLTVRFMIKVEKINDKRPKQPSLILEFLEIKPYLLFVQIINLSILSFQSQQTWVKIVGLVNVGFALGKITLLSSISVSYRFVEKNFIRRKNFAMPSWFLIVPFLFALHFYGAQYASLVLVLRASFQLYSNFNNLQNDAIRKYEWFYPCVTFQVVFIFFIQDYTGFQIFDSFIVLTFLAVFTVYCCNSLSDNLSILVLKTQVFKSQIFLQNQNEQNATNAGGVVEISSSELEKALLSLRILVKIYLSKLKSKSPAQKNAEPSDSFDSWWSLFDRLIVDHKIGCIKVTCLCSQLRPRSAQNGKAEERIFADKIYLMIKKLITRSSLKNNRLKMIENYYLIELQKKPFKTYYQLVRLARGVELRQEILEIQTLMEETRVNFKQLFQKQKVRNDQLDIEPLHQFQDQMKQMKAKSVRMAVQSKNFYDIFANNFVQMDILKKQSQILTHLKSQLGGQLDFLSQKFTRNLELMTLSLVYYEHFDEYTDKVEKMQRKAQSLSDALINPYQSMKGNRLDIFNPCYGSIKADLSVKPGTILSITNNLCTMLGYTRQQMAGQKINKLMPMVFAKSHDKFLRNFVEKGSVRMLKIKENVFYARNAAKLLVPISVHLKVEYMNSQVFYASTLIRKTPTKSDFILMNNYGKIEEVSERIYKLLFQKCFEQDVGRVKRLCVYKMLMSLNHFLKDLSENDDRVYQGLIVTSQVEQVMLSYYKFPELGKSYKKNSESMDNSSGKNSKSVDNSYSLSTDSAGDTQQTEKQNDAIKCNIDLRESFKEYFKSVDFSKIIGYRISFKFRDLVTSQFRCKVLQIVSIKEEISGKHLRQQLSRQIAEIAELFGYSDEIQSFKQAQDKALRQNASLFDHSEFDQSSGIQEESEGARKSQKTMHFEQISDENSVNIKGEQEKLNFINDGDSQASSMISTKEDVKKKQTMVSAFQTKVVVNRTLELILTGLIVVIVLILIIVCVFSINLKGDYQALQKDNLIISSFRINFLFRLALQQLYHFYHPLNITPPQFLSEKTHILTDSMKQSLIKSTNWIDPISSVQYFDKMTITTAESWYYEERPIISTLGMIYAMFLMTQEQGEHITENYVSINNHLLELSAKQESFIISQSSYSTLKIHITIGLYCLILAALVFVLFYLRHLTIVKQNKIMDLLPFLKSTVAVRNSIFFEQLCEYFKDNQNLSIEDISLMKESNDQQNDIIKKSNTVTSQKKYMNIFAAKFEKIQAQQSNSRLIRVVKNEKTQIKAVFVLKVLFTILLCTLLIFFSQYFFSQTHTKFKSYLQLKKSAMHVQLIPSRLVLLYFTNADKYMNYGQPFVYPENFLRLAHDGIFDVKRNLSNVEIYGTEMQQSIDKHFKTQICVLIDCQQNPSTVTVDQDTFYLAYRYLNAFQYLRKIYEMLKVQKDPIGTYRKWLDENNVLQLINAVEDILQLMKKNQKQITDLFTKQIVQIGSILMLISLILIPILVFVLLWVRNSFIRQISDRLQSTQNIYRNISWNMLMTNTYAINYFEDKLRNSKKY